ncbi:MAG: deoxyribodipyrimidine photo-lyase, partial [Gaiella sp.]
MRTAIVLFTRDLRVHDHPALHEACATFEAVVPLFVEDDGIRATRFGAAARRRAFLDDCLADLDAALRERGAALVVRRGDVVGETIAVARAVGAETVFASADVSPYARRREARLDAELDLRLVDGSYVVAAGEVAPSGGSFFQVFSPYHRAWSQVPLGVPLPAPGRVTLPADLDPGAPGGAVRSAPLVGGEAAAIARAGAFLGAELADYGSGGHDDLGREGTSRLSPYLHFGCLSPRSLAVRAAALPGGAAFVRQLCWRDFYAQLLWARPDSQLRDFRPRGDRWVDAPEALARWREGQTGFPLVDAGM